MKWKDEKISWHAVDLRDLGYIKNQSEWDEFQEYLCDTVQRYLELTPKHEVKLLEKER